MSIAQEQTTINTEIAAVRARWAEKRAQQQRQQAEDEAFNAAVSAQLHRELQERMAAHLPAWMLEYIEPEPEFDYDTATEFVALRLPGCAPVVAHYDSALAAVRSYEVRVPLRVECDDFWWVRTTGERTGDLDEAIDLAAACGESWHAMTVEADSHNAAGEFPTPPPQPPDTVAQAGELLARYAAKEHIGPQYSDRDDVILVSSLLYAIAHQLRRIADAQEADRG